MLTMVTPDVEIFGDSLVLMHSPDGTNVYGSRGRDIEEVGSVYG